MWTVQYGANCGGYATHINTDPRTKEDSWGSVNACFPIPVECLTELDVIKIKMYGDTVMLLSSDGNVYVMGDNRGLVDVIPPLPTNSTPNSPSLSPSIPAVDDDEGEESKWKWNCPD